MTTDRYATLSRPARKQKQAKWIYFLFVDPQLLYYEMVYQISELIYSWIWTINDKLQLNSFSIFSTRKGRYFYIELSSLMLYIHTRTILCIYIHILTHRYLLYLMMQHGIEAYYKIRKFPLKILTLGWLQH